jgi:tetratricopeptide (TPR) repeat protein
VAKVSLRIYNRDIENLIDQGHLDEAIAHCRHILKNFPKHLETYRLLGKAYLEAKRYDEAVDVLQRVLMSVPDDFVSHVGMSIIRDDQGKLDDAIWHMERAFESQPSNAAIQGELRRLYGRRDGVEPPKIRMTRGALAHMYVQGELYPQAISEIKAVLAQDPQRVDMQALLALAYFRSGQKADASQIANQLLNRPGGEFGFESNRVMVELLQGSDSAEDLQTYRQRVNELDPYAAVTQGSVFQSGMVSDAGVTLERLEYDGQIMETSSAGSAWNPPGISLTSPSQQPDWLAASASPTDEAPAPVSNTEQELPDFLRQAGWSESTGAGEETSSQFAFDQTPPVSGNEMAPGEMPDWLKAMSPADTSSSTSSEPASFEPTSDTPDWLASMGGSASSSTETPITPEDTPTWLRSFREETQEMNILGPEDVTQEISPSSWPGIEENQAEEVAPLESILPQEASAALETLGTTTQEQDDAVAWLEGLAAKHGAKPEELVTDPNDRSETPPEWVEQARAIAESMPAESVTDEPASFDSPSDNDRTGIWLREMAEKENLDEIGNESTPKTPSGLPVDQDAPNWLKNLDDTSLESTPSARFDARSSEPGGWMTEEPEAELLPSAADLPSWLQGLDREEPAVQPEPMEQDISTPDDASLPPWLKGDDDDSSAPVIPPTTPADWQPAQLGSETELEPETEPETVETEPSVRKAPPPTKSPASAPRPTSRPRQPEAELLEAALESAQSDLNRADIPAALERYEKLIKRGRFTEEIIRDLREALYRYPVEVTIWQTLGDAYMRANRLQEALDAYTKAEELLR